ncbi:MAG: SPOR domain-containing protein [Luteimonas sp.]
MDSGLKQRLIGAAVLVALAVIFLPMLVQGPAPNSGVSDVPLTMPDAPQGEYETRDLPLVTPGAAPNGGAVGMDTTDANALPTVDTAVPPPSASQPVPLGDTAVPAPTALPPNPAATPAMPAASKPEPMLPAAAAGGDYAVHFGSYATAANAESIVRQLRAAPLPGYSEPSMLNGKQVYRVRIGPYATRADAEAARLRASRVRDDVPARVIALDAEAASAAPAASQATASQTTASAITTQPLPAEPPKSSTAKPDVAKTDTSKPTTPASITTPKPTAAAGVGFAVQLGAFSKAADATALRDRVRAAGFNAFTETVNTDKGTLTRVRAGPVVGRADAEQLRLQVKAKTGVDGIVRPHP